MAQQHKTIHVEPDSELARVLSETSVTDVVLEQGGVRYRLVRIEAESESRSDQSEEAVPDTILNIIGVAASQGPTNIARHEQEYLAKAIDPTPRR